MYLEMQYLVLKLLGTPELQAKIPTENVAPEHCIKILFMGHLIIGCGARALMLKCCSALILFLVLLAALF
jgi:hypothetical protein